MKWHEVHDVYHLALLRIHHPNDERLFPGQLDSQISNEIDPEGEWAVDSILSHYEDALFEIKWRSGDITWMPYYQINRLQALVSYFEVLGINSVLELTTGKGKLPISNLQVFLGAIQFASESEAAKNYNSGSLYPNSLPYHSSDSTITIMAKSPFPSFKNYSTHLDSLTPAALQTVLHLYINHISDTLFIITDTFVSPIQHYTYLAVAIFACLTHDSTIRDDPIRMKDQPCPVRFNILAHIYNAEACRTQHFAYYAPHPPSNPAVTNGDHIQLDDWNITPAQCGLMAKNPLFQQLLEEDAARNLH